MTEHLHTDNFGPIFDADNHYWETSDAFTRHRDPKFRDRGLQVKEVDGVLRYLIGGNVFPTLPGPADVHPRTSPGAFLGFFAGRVKASEFTEAFDVAPSDHPEWYNRDARLRVMETQGIQSAWMFPSQGVVLEPAMLADDPEASIEVNRCFNRWIEEEWGFAYKDRIFAAPYMTLCDPDKAVAELKWCIERGARMVHLRHGPAVTRDGLRSPAHPMFDRFWGLAQEARVVVSSHTGAESCYDSIYAALRDMYGEQADGSNLSSKGLSFTNGSPFMAMMKGRQISDFAFILVAHRLFERFPGLRVAFVETGAAWVPSLLQALEYLDHGGLYKQNPREQFIEHCWVTPYPEDDVEEIARVFPAERILFGSDWPHGEGFAQPTDFMENIRNFSMRDQRRIMYENVRELTDG